jgi:adenylate cyclase
VNRSLRNYLRRRGATPEEIARAEAEGGLALLALDRQLLPGRTVYTFAEAADRAGFDVEVARRLWRALGFPDAPEDARRFSDTDVDALITLQRRFASSLLGGTDPNQAALVQYVRVIGGSLAKIAEVQSDQVVKAIRAARDAGLTDEQIAELVPEAVDWERMSRLTDYGLRLQLRAQLWRKVAADSPSGAGAEPLTVGFVDLVGYTALSQELEPEELGALVTRFEELAYDTVAEHGGRVVKTIGDEVMFVAEETSAAARIALRLTQSSAVDDILPDARAGLDCGDVLAQEGDYYGPVVNLASRLVEIARPGSVLASSAVHDALGEHSSFGWDRLRSRRIRDIGRVEVWKLERADDTNPGNHEGSGTVRSS